MTVVRDPVHSSNASSLIEQLALQDNVLALGPHMHYESTGATHVRLALSVRFSTPSWRAVRHNIKIEYKGGHDRMVNYSFSSSVFFFLGIFGNVTPKARLSLAMNAPSGTALPLS